MMELVKLGEACLVKRGTTITKKQTIKGDVPVIGGGTKPTYFHNQSNRDSNCITISGSGASAGFVNRWDGPIFASDCSTVEPKDEKQLHKFIYYFLLSRQEFIYENFRSGAAQPHVYAKDIETLDYPIIPIADQKQIVAKIDAAFAEISRLQNLVEKEILDAKSCHIQIEHNLISELLQFSKKAKLGEIANFKNGINFKKNESGKKYKIVGVGDFKSNFSINNEELESISLTGLIDNSYCLKGGDILFVRSNGNKNLIGRSLLVDDLSETTTFSGFTIRCRLEKDDLLPEFVCRFLKSKTIRKQLIDGGSGTSINNLNQKMLSALEIPIFEPKDQKNILDKINSIESSFEKLVTTNQHKLELLNSLKETILTQEMQSGNS